LHRPHGKCGDDGVSPVGHAICNGRFVFVHGGYPGELVGVCPTTAILISVVIVNLVIQTNLAVVVQNNFYGEFVGAVTNPAMIAVSDAEIRFIVDTVVNAAITNKLVKTI
jgi:hypothetical protein